MARYFVRLPNGLEAYSDDRREIEAIFLACAEVGACHMGFIRKCARHFLAHAIRKDYAPTLGHYERAVFAGKASASAKARAA